MLQRELSDAHRERGNNKKPGRLSCESLPGFLFIYITIIRTLEQTGMKALLPERETTVNGKARDSVCDT